MGRRLDPQSLTRVIVGAAGSSMPGFVIVIVGSSGFMVSGLQGDQDLHGLALVF